MPNEAHLEQLFQHLDKLDDPSEFKAFLEDLCTPAELKSMADRWRIARLLQTGESYRAIHEQTGISTTTITRVARSLTYGAKGYRLLLDKLEQTEK